MDCYTHSGLTLGFSLLCDTLVQTTGFHPWLLDGESLLFQNLYTQAKNALRRDHASSSKRAMRSSVGGCVEKSFVRLWPVSGSTMNMWF